MQNKFAQDSLTLILTWLKTFRLEWHKHLGKLKVQEKINKHKNKVTVSSMSHSYLKKLKYKRLKQRNKRSVSRPQYVEALIVADSTEINFHEDGDIETYLLTIMNMVSTILAKSIYPNYLLACNIRQHRIYVSKVQHKLSHNT